MRMIEAITTLLTAVFMVCIMLFVCFIPLMVVYANDLPELDMFARIMGCLIAIPMLRLTLNAIDWVSDLKYWRN